MSHTPRRRTAAHASCALLLVPLSAGLTACSQTSHPLSAKPYDASTQVELAGAAADGSKKVDPGKPLEVRATGSGGRITDVVARDAHGRYLRGELSENGTRWRSVTALAADAGYTVQVSTEDESEAQGRRTYSFRTGGYSGKSKPLKLEFGPEKGTYGVGQPLTVKLNKGVKDKEQRAVIERGLRVTSTPKVEGAWYWVDDKELHYRPKEYWPAHSKVTLTSNLEGIKVREGLYAGKTDPLELKIGSKVVAVTDAGSHYMSFYRDDRLINEIPVTTGKPGFETRNGKKVILEQAYYVRMRGASIGVAGTSEDYDMDVYWASRVTWSGEYVHAAPWSTGSQGAANVSHGCTGMSTGDAEWFYENARPGDIVEVVNSYGADMDPFGNGFGDWNVSWKKWREGSVLTAGTREGQSPNDASRLRPQI
ncbi:L,D-transpeptidase 2 [Streptomyces sp. RB5]|uniref:L,D-transpeptidase 2 n=1 Tax=Streptomyces smaragdinus TaxID=2585196 RepID=A0A7K0CPB0_9ACTN|nr:Ig-like domain-containing protein [Streptomyces smaragdinus]MQY15315.1 L,D-transpeptidase 2 [Streptomyces smaragdinus]